MGSKALQQARNWQPTKLPEARARGGGDDAAAAPSEDDAQAREQLVWALDPPGTQEPSDAVPEASQAGRGPAGKGHTHPGYFAPSPGPVYTPAPPEALAALRLAALLALKSGCLGKKLVKPQHMRQRLQNLILH